MLKKQKNKIREFINNGNVIKKLLGLEYKDHTDIIVSTYKEKIGDNPKNIDIIMDCFNTKGSISLIEAKTGTGKTYSINTVFNLIREANKINKAAQIATAETDVLTDEVLDKMDRSGKLALEEYKRDNMSYYYKAKKLSKNKKNKSKVEQMANTWNREVEKAMKYAKDATFRTELKKLLMDIELENSSLQIILCPNTVQNVQNELDEKYNFKAIVGNNDNRIEINDEKNYSIVYDKVLDVINAAKILDKDIKINLVVDEAHLLVENINFRSRAIHNLLEVANEVINKDGSVVFVTATKDTLKIFSFDKVVSFIPEEPIAMANQCTMYVNKDEKVSTLDYAASVMENLDNPFYRLNSFKGIEAIHEAFTKKGLKSLYATSKEKVFNYDKKEKTISCENSVINDVILNSSLPEADIIGGSSMLEAGTNIIGVNKNLASFNVFEVCHVIDEKEETITYENPETKKEYVIIEKNVTPTFICQDIRNMSINSIVQFFARTRYKVNEYALIMPYHKADKKFYTIEQIIHMEKKTLDKCYNSFNEIINNMKNMDLIDRDALKANAQTIINTMILSKGENMSLGCIIFNDADFSLEIDKIAFWKYCYDKFIGQYFYHIDKLQERLESALNVKVVIDDKPVMVKKNSIEAKKDMQIKKQLAKASIEDLKPREVEDLKDILNKTKDIKEIKNEKTVQKIEAILSVPDYKKDLKASLVWNVDINKMLDVIINAPTETEVKKFLYKAQFIWSNKYFLKTNGKYICNQEQKIILQELFELNEQGNLKEKRINDEMIQHILDRLNEEARIKKEYKEKDVWRLIEFCFTLDKSDSNKENKEENEEEIEEIIAQDNEEDSKDNKKKKVNPKIMYLNI